MLYQQPQNGPGLLSEAFLTPSTWAWTPSAFASGSGAVAPETVGSVLPYATSFGQARQVESTSAGIGIAPVGSMVPGRIGFVFQFQLTSLTSTVSNICGAGSNGTPNSYVEQFRLNCDVSESGSAGKFNLALRDAAGNKLNVSTSSAVLALGQFYTLIIFADSGTTAKAWLNGQPIAVVTSGLFTATALSNAQKQWMIGNFNYGSSLTGHADANFGTSGGAAKFSLVARVEGGLEKFQALAQNPYQIFVDVEEDDEILYVQAAVSGPTYTLTAASGAIPISGGAASLKAARKLAAASGAVAIAGASAGLTAARKLAAGTGSLLIAGNAAALTAARKLVASGGQINISGSAAGLAAARRLSSASGALPVAGGAAGLRAARKLTAASGALAIVGRAANFVYTPISGATYTLSCGSGAIPISGRSASLIVARKLLANSGALAISGQAAGLKSARRLVASGAAVGISGAGVNLRAARRLVAGGGALPIAGAAASLQYSGGIPITDPTTYISPARTAIFEGMGTTVIFEGLATTAVFEGFATTARF